MKDQIEGGKADNDTVDSIAKKWDVPTGDIEKELADGIGVEREHTDDPKKAREIALDHLIELPDYYTRLDDMEKKGKEELKAKLREGLTKIGKRAS